MRQRRQAALLAGRTALVLLLLVGGVQKLRYAAGTAAYLSRVGVPGAGKPLVVVAASFEIAAALMMLVGWRTRLAAIAAAVYLVPVTWYAHLGVARAAADLVIRDQETFEALKNLSLIGGLLLLWASGPGEHSLDRK